MGKETEILRQKLWIDTFNQGMKSLLSMSKADFNANSAVKCFDSRFGALKPCEIQIKETCKCDRDTHTHGEIQLNQCVECQKPIA